MTEKLRLVFFGNERLSTGFASDGRLLQSLIDAGYDIAAVVANQGDTASRVTRSLEVAGVAETAAIPVLTPSKPIDIVDELLAMKPTAGVLAAYGRIVPQEIIDIFPKGIINIHPSLLPSYRGPTPIEQSILDGVDKTGVSIMGLSAKMDTGPVFAQSVVALNGSESKQELTEKLLDLGGELLLAALPKILQGELAPRAQNEAAATYCALIKKEHGIIDWTKSATQIEREVRAFAGWPKSRTKLGEKLNVTVIKARVIDSPVLAAGQIKADSSGLLVGTGEGVLSLLEVQPDNKAPMLIGAFLNGYLNKLSVQAA